MRRQTSEAGESLIEVLVAVVILGLGVTALLGGMATAVFGSAVHRNQADVSAVMTAAGEWVKQADYITCADFDDYLSPTGPQPFAYPGHVVTATAADTLTVSTPTGVAVWTVRFAIKDWQGDDFFARPNDCATADAEGLRMQQVTITVRTADGKIDQSLRVIKRFNDCRPPLPRSGCDTT